MQRTEDALCGVVGGHNPSVGVGNMLHELVVGDTRVRKDEQQRRNGVEDAVTAVLDKGCKAH